MFLLETFFILSLLVLSSATLYGYASLRKCWRINKLVAGVEIQNGDHVNQERAGPVDYSEYREPLIGLYEN